MKGALTRRNLTHAPGVGKTVALTFDDGASPSTPEILSVLASYQVPATFFDTGLHDAAHPEQARQITRCGHVLGNHTWSHLDLEPLCLDQQINEMDRTSAEQVRLTGLAPRLFRPPYGRYNEATLHAARRRGLRVALWSVDTGDWEQSSTISDYWTGEIVRRASSGLQQRHPLLLMHAGKASHEPDSEVATERHNTVAALPYIIEMYRDSGYRFVDLLGRCRPD